MLFNSVTYAFFLPIVFFLYWLLPHKYRCILLWVASYYFYMNWNPKYVLLLLLITAVSYIAAIILEGESRETIRKFILLIVCIFCLGVLFFYKYFNFFSSFTIGVMNRLSFNAKSVELNLILPVGISFYTLQALSYVIDVYRRKVGAERNFGIYATFVSFFPQLVAGPIERTSNLLPQIKNEKNFDYNEITYGLKLLTWGFFKKLVIADNIAAYVDTVWKSLETYKGFDFVIVSIFFTIQIYCDFSGYSDIAVGTAKMLGINLMTNFKTPYFASSIKEFWNRWHISLSTWLRDYVYIPLGGSKCSRPRHYINLMITFLLSGLWHGANWTFVIWGGMHGLARIIESEISRKIHMNKFAKTFYVFVVFIFCNLAWIFFRAETISDACFVLENMFAGIMKPTDYFTSSIIFSSIELIKISVGILLLVIYDYFSLKTDVIEWLQSCRAVYRWSIYIAIVMIIILFAPVSMEAAFIYFQF